ncbi:MAG: PD-(D/E)XK motif protein, partial [Candidatus Aenigmarchaeota archaeon]|nr:PD-(D/E)XK motif protein [Candidatus Aenigmarchaeota archaeon]
MVLRELLSQIKSDRKSSSYSVASFNNSEKIFVGLDVDDRPCVFVSVTGNEEFPSIRTAQIKVEYSRKYSLHLHGNIRREGIFHGIFCLSKEKIDISTFVTIMEYMLIELGDNVTIESMNSIFRSLVNLFSIKPSQDYLTERRGLWAELYFMKHYRGFNFWSPFWHSEPTRLFDFSNQGKRIEIKSTIRSERIHDFSHGQLLALSSEKIIIVSFMLQEDDS